uniref:Uncharacterized protein n=1 Tax=Rhizophora mucronata TaxID=61149 RepID=A0A2P2QXW9_RHIMU
MQFSFELGFTVVQLVKGVILPLFELDFLEQWAR